MSGASPDTFVPRLHVRPGRDFRLSGVYVTLFVGQAGNLNRRRASQVAGFVAATIAAVAYVRWWVLPPLLSSWPPGFAAVKPTTALCLVALGLVLAHPRPDWRFAFAAGLVVAGIGTLDL